MTVTYAFTVSLAEKQPLRGMMWEPVIQLVVDPERDGIDALAEHLHDWALETLRERRCDLGLYLAEFGTLDEEGYPDRVFRHHHIPWSGLGILPVSQPRDRETMPERTYPDPVGLDGPR